MMLAIIAILFFSSLSSGISTHWSNEGLRENETQAVIIDADIFELNEEPEIQDLTETAGNKVSQTPTEPIENVMPQKSAETSQDIDLQTSTEFEISDFENVMITTVGVAIYSDNRINNTMSSIDWGKLEPGAKKNIECYIQNTGKTPVILTLETANWTPQKAANYITLAWDYDGQKITIDEIIHVILTLTISENIQGITNFFFEIIIIGNNI